MPRRGEIDAAQNANFRDGASRSVSSRLKLPVIDRDAPGGSSNNRGRGR